MGSGSGSGGPASGPAPISLSPQPAAATSNTTRNMFRFMPATLAIAAPRGLAARAADLALHATRRSTDTGSVTAGTVRAGVTATFRSFLARYPRVSADRLIQAAGIEPRRIGDPDAQIDQQQWVALLEAAADATGNPCLGLELALQVPWKDLGVLAYVALNSPTLGAALENSAR